MEDILIEIIKYLLEVVEDEHAGRGMLAAMDIEDEFGIDITVL